MIDPADNVTRALPQPTRMSFTSNGRVYTAVLDQDLLGDWTVSQSWGGTETRRAGCVTYVDTFEAGLTLLQAIAKKRAKHGYRLA